MKSNYFKLNKVVPSELVFNACRKLNPAIARVAEIQLWDNEWLEYHATATDDMGKPHYFFVVFNKDENEFKAMLSNRNFRHTPASM